MPRHLQTDPTLAAAEAAAFEQAAAAAGSHPASVLYLAPSERPRRQVRDRWEAFGSPIQLQLSNFDTIVADVLESQFYETRARNLSAEQRQRLVESAVDSLPDAAHPMAANGESASAEACSQAEDLLSLLEFASLPEPGEIEADDRLSMVHSKTRDALVELSRAFDQRRGSFGDEESAKTLRSERYERVIENPAALAATLESVDVVILGPFTFFSPIEARLIDVIADCADATHAVLPLAGRPTDSPGDQMELGGIDRGAQRAWHQYNRLGFTVQESPRDRSPAASLARDLYRFTPETSTSAKQLRAAGVAWHTYPTPTHEIRGTAREIRQELAAGEAPEEIGVVAPGLTDRQRELFETFRQYGIPARMTEETSLAGTEVGSAIDHLLRLGAGDGRVQDVLRLVDNPLVDPDWPTTQLTPSDLVQLVDRVEVTRLDTLEDLLTDDDNDVSIQTAVDWLLDLSAELAAASPARSGAALTNALTALGIIDEDAAANWSLATATDRPSWVQDREAAALKALHRVADSLEGSAALDDRSVGDRLPRALASTTVEASLGARTGVRLLRPNDALQHDISVVFAIGLTETAFPSQPRRLAFTREVNDAHPDFEPTDPTRQARHALGLLPAQADRVVLSHPDQTADGNDTVVADFLAELQRLCTDDFTPTQRTDDTHPPQCREDVHRKTASVLDYITQDHATDSSPGAVTDQIATSGIFESTAGDPATRLAAGVECAVARQSPQTTVYDGALTTQTVEQFEESDAALSPSRIDTYATCGFKFYAKYLLDYRPPDERTLEADALATGQFVHEVLARFFQSLQSQPGDPITIEHPTDHHDAMYQAAQTELDKPYMRQHASTFHDGWLTRLLAGLTPGDTGNEYDGPPGYRGLFARVLETIADEHDQITVRPSLFEAAIGLDPHEGEATTLLREDPVELVDGVRVRGKVDRVDIVPDSDPREFVAIDYKTGSTPSIDEVHGGVSFQLPLYLRMLDAALGEDMDWTPIGAAYYDLDIPSAAGLQTSPLTSTDDAVWHQSSGAPLLRHSKDSLFDSRAAFREFLYDDVDQRLRDVTESLQSGIFHPTLLDADTANCEYCDYAHVCDVRHHHRQERLTEHGQPAAYVPAYARPTEDRE